MKLPQRWRKELENNDTYSIGYIYVQIYIVFEIHSKTIRTLVSIQQIFCQLSLLRLSNNKAMRTRRPSAIKVVRKTSLQVIVLDVDIY